MNMKLAKRILIGLVCCLLVHFTTQVSSYGASGQSDEQSQAPAAQQSPQELQQLVAPIALYPDALVAQVLCCDAGNTGRTILLEHPMTRWQGCPVVWRSNGRFGCTRWLRHEIQGDASVRERAERKCNPGCRGRKLAVSDSVGEQPRFLVLRHSRGERRDPVPPCR